MRVYVSEHRFYEETGLLGVNASEAGAREVCRATAHPKSKRDLKWLELEDGQAKAADPRQGWYHIYPMDVEP